MNDWLPRVLAAGGDGVGGGGGGESASGSGETTGKPRRRRSSKATLGYAGNWRARNIEMRQRIAQWFRWTRQQKLHMSRYELADAAIADGVELTEPVVRRLENMTDRAVAEARHWLAIEYVLWLATYSGQSFIDVARFLVGGDWTQVGVLTDSTPSADVMADRVRTTFLNLSEQRKQSALDHLVFLQSLDDLDRQHAAGGRHQTSHSRPTKPNRTAGAQADETSEGEMMEYVIDPATQAVIDDLRHGAEELHQRLIEHERQDPRKRVGGVSDEQQNEQSDEQRRKPS